MKYCPQCGEPLLAGAKFCVECGRELSGAATGAGPDAWTFGRAHEPVLRGNSLTLGFAGVFVGITIFGLVAAAWIYFKTPAVVSQEAASAPPELPTSVVRAPAAGGQGAATKAAAALAAGGKETGGLPPGHPHIELPTEARTFIDQVEKDARAKPKDIATWNKLGDVSMRAALFDQTYYAKAEDAYAHVLKLDPDNLGALRGIGDIDYDQRHYDEAIATYEHYLKRKPDDPEVRTDLGTMYLYTGNADQAVVQYQKAIATKPDFFQAYFNMGIALAQENKPDLATTALNKALSLAPDDPTRNQVKQIIAKLVPAPASATSSAARTAASPPPAKDFGGEVDAMVRALPVAGPKVDSVQWPDKLHAKVMFHDFPMDAMPPVMKDKFVSDVKSKIETAKQDHKIAGKVTVDLVDGATGRVMATVED